ncbi:MAG: class I SAM-dependent methyltransferase [Patescibacteria group bacterium]
MLILISTLFILFIIAAIMSVALGLDSMLRGHDIPTNKSVINKMIQVIEKHNCQEKTFLDLGCARGVVALAIKKHFPKMNVSGVELYRLRVYFARAKAFFLRRDISLIIGDALKQDVSKADIVFCYLWYDLMPALEKKLLDELKTGAIVITNTSKFPNWVPLEIVRAQHSNTVVPDHDTLFVYQRQ